MGELEIWRPWVKEAKEIELTVTSYGGHYNDDDKYHPSRLLDGDMDTQYLSEDEVVSGDYIDFAVSEEAQFIPSKIKIRNSSGDDGIKCISLLVRMKKGEKLVKLCEDIGGIEKQ